ncbi:MAG TPA: hypothetical protein VGZ73_30110 [Bryobacteraceae bacterium]|jgi:hypothetical protein|nr:hypothetical protein [Bryobacteraceae bacterium]
MSLDISLETEARIKAKAKERGLSVDAYLRRQMESPRGVRGLDILKEAGIKPAGTPNGDAPQLPVWNLGVRGTLRRVEIYGDED